MSPRVRQQIQGGVEGRVSETPKEGSPVFKKCVYTLVGNNNQSLDASAAAARSLGYTPIVLYEGLEGEATKMADKLIQMARDIKAGKNKVKAPAAIIAGGETTVNLGSKFGLGGRNQEMALEAAMKLRGESGITFLSGGTDGTDGPCDAAGGVVDGASYEKGLKKGLKAEDFLKAHDAYNYLKHLDGEHIMTGPTGTNVMDIAVVLVEYSVCWDPPFLKRHKWKSIHKMFIDVCLGFALYI